MYFAERVFNLRRDESSIPSSTHTVLWKWLADAARCRDVLRGAMKNNPPQKGRTNDRIPPSKLNVTVTELIQVHSPVN
jgi:hypothetical protein